MKLLFLALLLPSIALAECKIAIDDIKPTVRNALSGMHSKSNETITIEEFAGAKDFINDVISKVMQCYEFVAKVERRNPDFNKWGEESDRYYYYALPLRSLELQLDTAIRSFSFGQWRNESFDINMWEKVATEFYDRKI